MLDAWNTMMHSFASPFKGAHDIGEMSVTRIHEQFSEASAAPDISGRAIPGTFVARVYLQH
jgi:hypothetical protein